MSRFVLFKKAVTVRSICHPERPRRGPVWGSEGSLSMDSSPVGVRMTSRFMDYFALTKPRVVSMVLLSTMTGFYLGTSGSVDPFSFLATLLATACVAAGSMALNQLMERDIDAKMIRTQIRPLPAGRLQASEALTFGCIVSALGFFLFVFCVNLASALLALITWASYLFIYTPLKSKTSLSTIIGAVPGALPPMIGWAGANGTVNFQAFLLFMIIFFWQMPHFLSIAWMYRDDYIRSGQPILSVIDREGKFVARQMILNMCALIPVSLLPTIFGVTGTIYFFGAFGLGICFAGIVIFASPNLDLRARYVLRASILYLAALLLLMVMGRI